MSVLDKWQMFCLLGNVSAMLNNGWTTQDDLNLKLLIAVGEGRLGDAEALIAAGADVNTKDRTDETPLHTAAMQRNVGMVELLIEKGALVYERYGGRMAIDLTRSCEIKKMLSEVSKVRQLLLYTSIRVPEFLKDFGADLLFTTAFVALLSCEVFCNVAQYLPFGNKLCGVSEYFTSNIAAFCGNLGYKISGRTPIYNRDDRIL